VEFHGSRIPRRPREARVPFQEAKGELTDPSYRAFIHPLVPAVFSGTKQDSRGDNDNHNMGSAKFVVRWN
jgi:hypothetical protein